MEHKGYVGLLVPGYKPGELEKAFRMAVPSLTIDLYGTVPEQEQCAARHLVGEALGEFHNGGKKVTIWLPTENTDIFKKYIDVFSGHGEVGIRVSSLRSAEQLKKIEAALEETAGDSLIPSIELVVDDVEIYNKLEDICRNSAYLKVLSIGVYDLWNSMAADRQKSVSIPQIKRHIAEMAKAYTLIPVDSVYINYTDLERLEEDCRISREMGFWGRSFIHPSQIKAGMKIYCGGE
ncbi:MAG TPA: aldolase/citrate lyase family protein [Ruminiclostridium sp.]|nr:aldolase/citrate lyase family protein [Ruminiclostridium sp.]